MVRQAQLGQVLPERGDLCRGERDELHWLLRFDSGECWKRDADRHGHSVEVPAYDFGYRVFPIAVPQDHLNSECLEDLGEIDAAGSGTRTIAEPFAGQLINRPYCRFFRDNELERRIEHREDGPHRAVLGAFRPTGAIPALQGDAHGGKAEHRLALFEQSDVLTWTLRRLRRDLDSQRMTEDCCDTLTVNIVGAARRCGAQRYRFRPRGLGGADFGRNAHA